MVCKRMKSVSCIYVHLLCVVNNPLRTGLATPPTDSLAYSADPDEMPQHAAFHQGLHCLLRQNQSSEKYNIFWKFNL